MFGDVISEPHGIEIRRITRSDEQALLVFFEATSELSRRQRFHHHVDAFPTRHLDDLLDSTDLVGLAAFRGAELIGVASGTTCSVGAGELAVWVRDDWRRRGVGRRLLTAAINALAVRGLPYVFARVESVNSAAVGLTRAVFAPGAHRRPTATGEVVSMSTRPAPRRTAA